MRELYKVLNTLAKTDISLTKQNSHNNNKGCSAEKDNHRFQHCFIMKQQFSEKKNKVTFSENAVVSSQCITYILGSKRIWVYLLLVYLLASEQFFKHVNAHLKSNDEMRIFECLTPPYKSG